MGDAIRIRALLMANASLAAAPDGPPPPYRSRSSSPTNRPQIGPQERRRERQRPPLPDVDPELLWGQREASRAVLLEEHPQSVPREQYLRLYWEERKEISKALNRIQLEGTGLGEQLTEDEQSNIAHERIKARWIKQGIWRDIWNQPDPTLEAPFGPWAHEEPLELESETESDPEAPPTASGRRRRPKSDQELRLIAKRRAQRERNRDKSRPYGIVVETRKTL
ncbi:hypothetical protein F5X97DRAFT_314271 [Nemania serpens]|nr:hypothetical protein F5X97DRAFT_314271 [Nemania serpens]